MSHKLKSLTGLRSLYEVQSFTISVLELLPVVEGDCMEEVQELLVIKEEEVGLEEKKETFHNNQVAHVFICSFIYVRAMVAV